jgi:hypothetical protein
MVPANESDIACIASYFKLPLFDNALALTNKLDPAHLLVS